MGSVSLPIRGFRLEQVGVCLFLLIALMEAGPRGLECFRLRVVDEGLNGIVALPKVVKIVNRYPYYPLQTTGVNSIDHLIRESVFETSREDWWKQEVYGKSPTNVWRENLSDLRYLSGAPSARHFRWHVARFNESEPGRNPKIVGRCISRILVFHSGVNLSSDFYGFYRTNLLNVYVRALSHFEGFIENFPLAFGRSVKHEREESDKPVKEDLGWLEMPWIGYEAIDPRKKRPYLGFGILVTAFFCAISATLFWTGGYPLSAVLLLVVCFWLSGGGSSLMTFGSWRDPD